MNQQNEPRIWQRMCAAIIGRGQPFAQFPARFGSARKRERRLRLRETVSLGERRFLALVEVGKHEFLVGGTSASVSLLKDLSSPAETSSGLRKVQAV